MPRSGRLQRGAGVSLWRQIADRIRVDISRDLADENGRLPSEIELAERFGVNRHTVRAAISALAHEGVLHAAQGRGTYVRKQKRLVYPISEKTRFSAGLENQSRERKSKLLDHRCEAASAEIAGALGLSEGAQVVRLELLGSADGAPVSRSTSWFDAARFSDIADHFIRTGSITKALRGMGLHDYSRASTAIEAVHADEIDTADLRLSPGAIVLVTRAVNVAPDDSPVQYSQTRFAADRITLLVETHGIQKFRGGSSINPLNAISSTVARSKTKRTSKN
jgi:GntR family phosphonate transport system transcriptional regulator